MEMNVQKTKIAHQYPRSNQKICPMFEAEEINPNKVENGETRDWAFLPSPLPFLILDLLTTLQDFFAFRGVCKNWRSLSSPDHFSLSSQSPIILLSCGEFRGLRKVYYDITQKRMYKSLLPWGLRTRKILGCSHNHLIAGPSRSNQNVLLCNLFTGAKKRLPQAPSNYERVILSSSPSDPNCMVTLFNSDFDSDFHYCRFEDKQWGSYKNMYFKDMIFLNQKLYALTNDGELGIIDFVPEPKLVLLKTVNILQMYPNVTCRWCLAELCGELLVIVVKLRMFDDLSPRMCQVKGYDVWHWDVENGGGLSKVLNLGKRALFIRYSGFEGWVSSLGTGIRENCIYDIYSYRNCWAVYSLDDGRIYFVTPASYHFVNKRLKQPPVWIIPSLC